MSDFPRILVAAAYFGCLPDTFPLWLTSCRFNPDIDWLVVTDAPTEVYDFPPNVHVHAMTMAAFAERLSEFAGVLTTFNTPYKACDYRPLYSCLTDMVPGRWDFWGHCDLDMLFGDVRRFLTPEILAANDKIFGVGHFTLYRNDDDTNQYYRRPHPDLDYRAILADPVHRAFDEHVGVNRIWKLHNGRFHEDETVLADIDPHIDRMVRTSTYAKVENHSVQVFCFDRGTVRRLYWAQGAVQAQDFMYIHFQKRRFDLAVPAAEVDRVYITPRGFLPMECAGEPDRALLMRLNPRPIFSHLREISHRLRQQLRQARTRLKAERAA